VNASLGGNSTVVSVEPNKTVVGSPGKDFTIDIDISDANETYAWQIGLSWNASMLNLTDITEGTFLSQNTYNTSLALDPPVAIVINYTEGWVLIGNTLLEEPLDYPIVNGTLATITFTVLDFPVLDVENCTLDLYDTELVYSDGKTGYDHTAKDGEFHLLLGDVSRDGIVNVDDLYLINVAYGSTPDAPNWNVECDLNNDKVVDVYDLAIVGKKYGNSC
jgi:hypothetical protein